MNKREYGKDKEDIAVLYLQNNNIEIIERNYYTKHGEIDIIGRDGEYIVFFEVKYRKTKDFGEPLLSVNKKKIRNIVNASKIFLYLNHFSESTYIRFDCISIIGNEIAWIKNAFDAF